MHAHLRSSFLLATISYCLVVGLTAAQPPITETSAGVDAKGVRHIWTTNAAKRAPWQADVTKLIPPDYPYVARRSKLEGSGLFRLRIDLATGKVSNVTIVKSTGVDVLDKSALWALRRWEFKPGRWKELDTPVTFTMSAALPGPPKQSK